MKRGGHKVTIELRSVSPRDFSYRETFSLHRLRHGRNRDGSVRVYFRRNRLHARFRPTLSLVVNKYRKRHFDLYVNERGTRDDGWYVKMDDDTKVIRYFGYAGQIVDP